MTRHWIEAVLWGGVLVATGVGLYGLHFDAALIDGKSLPVALVGVASVPLRPTADSLDAAVGLIADGNLFRSERASAEERSTPKYE